MKKITFVCITILSFFLFVLPVYADGDTVKKVVLQGQSFCQNDAGEYVATHMVLNVDLDGGEFPSGKKYDDICLKKNLGLSAIIKERPTKKDYVFSGWQCGATGKQQNPSGSQSGATNMIDVGVGCNDKGIAQAEAYKVIYKAIWKSPEEFKEEFGYDYYDKVGKDDEKKWACGGFVSTDLLKEINKIYRTIGLVVVAVVIILGVLDFMKAISSDDDSTLKKSASKFMKRIVIAILIVALPIILQLFLDMFGNADMKECLDLIK